MKFEMDKANNSGLSASLFHSYTGFHSNQVANGDDIQHVAALYNTNMMKHDGSEKTILFENKTSKSETSSLSIFEEALCELNQYKDFPVDKSLPSFETLTTSISTNSAQFLEVGLGPSLTNNYSAHSDGATASQFVSDALPGSMSHLPKSSPQRVAKFSESSFLNIVGDIDKLEGIFSHSFENSTQQESLNTEMANYEDYCIHNLDDGFEVLAENNSSFDGIELPELDLFQQKFPTSGWVSSPKVFYSSKSDITTDSFQYQRQLPVCKMEREKKESFIYEPKEKATRWVDFMIDHSQQPTNLSNRVTVAVDKMVNHDQSKESDNTIDQQLRVQSFCSVSVSSIKKNTDVKSVQAGEKFSSKFWSVAKQHGSSPIIDNIAAAVTDSSQKLPVTKCNYSSERPDQRIKQKVYQTPVHYLKIPDVTPAINSFPQPLNITVYKTADEFPLSSPQRNLTQHEQSQSGVSGRKRYIRKPMKQKKVPKMPVSIKARSAKFLCAEKDFRRRTVRELLETCETMQEKQKKLEISYSGHSDGQSSLLNSAGADPVMQENSTNCISNVNAEDSQITMQSATRQSRNHPCFRPSSNVQHCINFPEDSDSIHNPRREENTYVDCQTHLPSLPKETGRFWCGLPQKLSGVGPQPSVHVGFPRLPEIPSQQVNTKRRAPLCFSDQPWVKVFLPVPIENQDMKKGVTADDKIFRSKHFDFTTLEIRSFQYSISSQKSGMTARLKIIFSKKKLIYEFQLNELEQNLDLQVKQMAVIEIPFENVSGLWGFGEELRLEVSSPPNFYTGFKNCYTKNQKLPHSQNIKYDRSKMMDVTQGEVSRSPYHYICFKSACVAKIKYYLQQFSNYFAAIQCRPFCEDFYKVLPTVSVTNNGNLLKNESLDLESRKNMDPTFCSTCHSTDRENWTAVMRGGWCSSRDCSCYRNKAESDRWYICKDNCDNPLNILCQHSISMELARKDLCLMHNIFKIKNLKSYLSSELKVKCCQVPLPVRCCIPGQIFCPNCCACYRYSWCLASLCDEKTRHCGICHSCTTYQAAHCNKCNRCYPVLSSNECPTCSIKDED